MNGTKQYSAKPKKLTHGMLSRSLFYRTIGQRRQGIPDIQQSAEHLEPSVLARHAGIFGLVTDLRNSLSASNWTTEPRDALRQNDYELYTKIATVIRRTFSCVCFSSSDVAATEDEKKSIFDFIAFGGPYILIEFCQRSMPPSMGGQNKGMERAVKGALGSSFMFSEGNKRSMFNIYCNMWNECLEILRELFMACPVFSSHLARDDSFIAFLFKVMSCKGTFTHAIHLCEELVAIRTNDFSLIHVTNLRELICNLSSCQMTLFCRVLSVLVYEASERSRAVATPLMTAELLTLRRSKYQYKSIDMNHDILLSIPEFLPRLVHLVRVIATETDVDSSSNDSSAMQGVNTLEWILLIDVESVHRDMDSIVAEQVENGLQSMNELHPMDKYPVDALPWESERRSEKQQQLDELQRANVEDGSRVEIVHDEQTNGSALGSRSRWYNSFASTDSCEQDDDDGNESDTNGFLRNLVVWSAERTRQSGWHNTNPSYDSGNGLNEFDMMRVIPRMLGNTEYVRNFALKQYFIEVLFVLSTLLAERKKKIVQDRTIYLGIVEALYLAFDKLNWDSLNEAHPPERIHGPNCECVPESALKMQYLRLCHNLLDRDSDNTANKRLFLSETEEQIGGIYANLENLPKTALNKTSLTCRTSEFGLLHKITKVLLNLSPTAEYPFWVATCIEGFLRGASSAERTMLCKWGLLQFLIDSILSTDFKGMSALQTNFDVLGECLKFNREGFAMLTSILSEEKVVRLFEAAANHLIESNVFLRTVFLSLNHFVDQDSEKLGLSVEQLSIGATDFATETWQPYPCNTCPAYKWIMRNRIKLLRGLMTCVAVDTVSQDNVCCINTSIVILIYAKRRGCLSETLQQVSQYTESEEPQEMPESSDGKSEPLLATSNSVYIPPASQNAFEAETESGKPKPTVNRGPLRNFRQLLWIWEEYYSLRDRDCRALSHSSGIEFQEWVATIQTLCGRGVYASDETSLIQNSDSAVEYPELDYW